MHSYVLRCAMRVPSSIDKTFDVFENPHNLARITPPWLNFNVLHGSLEMRHGLLLDYKIRWFGLPLGWQTLITGYNPPAGFIDFQNRGPFRLWHHVHRFVPQGPRSTLVSDEVTYVLPLGVLGRVAHAATVRRQLLGIFRFRQTALAGMLGGADELASPTIEPGLAITEQQLADYRACQRHGPSPKQQLPEDLHAIFGGGHAGEAKRADRR
jgi:ligand-binding SRPBCC domain-containing protein